MSENSKIEWCDHTYNPWIGCTKVSPGCLNCYAAVSTRARVLRAAGQETWGKGAPRSRTKTQGDPKKWNREAGEMQRVATLPLGNGLSGEGRIYYSRRPRVFCASLADWLDDEVPVEWLADLLQLIHDTPALDYLLLTKRPQNWATRISEVLDVMSNNGAPDNEDDLWGWLVSWQDGNAPVNVWVGTTVEDQTRADQRIPALLKIPAAVRFLSCEPLLGPVMLPLGSHRFCPECAGTLSYGDNGPGIRGNSEVVECDQAPASGIHWVIAGGESGPGARPMHPDWARSLRDQCRAADVAYFFKQLGSNPVGTVPVEGSEPLTVPVPKTDKKGGDFDSLPEDLRIREFPSLQPR